MSLQHWEEYYRGGALATGPTGADGAYDLEVLEGWQSFFLDLPEGARLLDIGTGNGVIPAIAVQVAAVTARRFDIHGADLAQIDPLRDVPGGADRLMGVQFHPGTAAESLPFEDAAFDALSGHYALEYTDIRAALGEVHRVLKPGGQGRFVLHHSESVLLHNARLSLAQADYVLSDLKIYRRVRKVVTMVDESHATVQRASDELRAAIQALKGALAVARQTTSSIVIEAALEAVQKLLAVRSSMTPAAMNNEVDRAEEELRASVRRLNDLLARAKSAQDMVQIQQLASELGFIDLQCREQLHAGNNLVGWCLVMRRN